MRRPSKSSQGFTIIEFLIVSAIIVFTSIALIKNFSTSRFNIDKVAQQLVSDLRIAQSYALSTKKTNNVFRCGYGLTRLSTTSYAIYAGRDPSISCTANRNYNSSQNPIVTTRIFNYQTINIYPFFGDIFFESPGLKTYINNTTGGSMAPEKIFIRTEDTDCVNSFNSGRCRLICVYTSGKIELNKSSNVCPSN